MARPTTKSPYVLDIWEFKLYVAGHTLKCKSAFANLKKLCEKCIQGKCRIEVIDLLENPQPARDDQIITIPTPVKTFPLHLRKTIGSGSLRGSICPVEG